MRVVNSGTMILPDRLRALDALEDNMEPPLGIVPG